MGARQKRRIKWLAAHCKPHRVGTETPFGDMLLTRVLRKPPTWTVEKVDPDGDVLMYQLRKSAKGTPHKWLWHLVGPYTDTIHATRRGALRFCADIIEPKQPFPLPIEEGMTTDDETIL